MKNMRCAHVGQLVLTYVLLAAVACIGSAAAAGQFATPGPAPDVVGSFVDLIDIGVISASGSFIYQSSIRGESPYVGRYLSHQCNPDGSWYTDYLQYFFDEDGNVNQTTRGCGTGHFVDGLYTSIYALNETDACPISPTARTETAYHTFVPGSGLGSLLNGTYCSPLRRGVATHQVYEDRTGLLGEDRTPLSPLGFTRSSE